MLLAALALFVALAPAARPLRNVVFDGYQRLLPLERTTEPVAIVLIDEEALLHYGQWPWPRTRVAELVVRISQYQPAAIGLDLLFPEPDRFSPGAIADELPILPENLAQALRSFPSNDERFAELIRGRNVVMGFGGLDYIDTRFRDPPRAAPIVTSRVDLDRFRTQPGHIASLDLIDAAAAGHGLLTGPEDRVVRAVPYVSRVHDVLVPALGVEVLRVATRSGLRLQGEPGGLLTLRFADISTTLQDDGTTWLRFSHYDSNRAIPAQAIFTGAVDAERLRGKIVLLGVSGLGLVDFKTTPLGEVVPGVAIHGQVIENLFNDVSLVRLEEAPLVEAAALVLCGLLLIIYVPRVSALKAIHLAFGMVVVLFGMGFIAFHRFQLLFDFAWPAIGTVAVFTSAIVGTLTEIERQRRVLRDQAARMAGEVNAARRIQMGLLPDPHELPGDGRRFQIAAELEPARTVGGDFYDCFMLGDRRLFFVVADVSGKGLPAALFMASVKSHLKSAALRGGEVGDVLSRAQEEINRENPEQLFVTAFAAIVDIETGDMEFANAGHEPPFVRTPRGAPERIMEAGGPPLCVIQEFAYQTWRRKLIAGEWLCVVTDGATEAMNPQRDFFGVERLRTSLSWMPEDADPAELIRRLREDIARFAAGAEPADDITLLVLKWMGKERVDSRPGPLPSDAYPGEDPGARQTATGR